MIRLRQVRIILPIRKIKPQDGLKGKIKGGGTS